MVKDLLPQRTAGRRRSLVLALVSALCGLAVIYPYVGYPAILKLARKKRIERGKPDAADGAAFSLVFCAYNEASVMPAKLSNLHELKTRYPGLQVLAFDDGSDDGTPDMIADGAPYVRLIRGSGRNGKAHGMKLLAAEAAGEFLVFTDANVILDPGALDALAACYSDPSVGGVCGALRYLGAEGSSTATVGGAYWRLEEKIKDLESATGSVMGADGSIFSIRRALYPDFPDNVLDDFTVSLECVFQGFRLVKSNDVVAYEKLVSARSDEFSRKIRIAGRAFTTHRYLRDKRRHMEALDRFKYFSHKTLRWFNGAFLVGGTSTALLAALTLSPLFAVVLATTTAAMLAMGLRKSHGSISSVVETVSAMVATQIGVIKALFRETPVTWNPSKSRS